jgi:hypothetical protein
MYRDMRNIDSKYGYPRCYVYAAGIFTLYKLFENLKEKS